MYQVTPLAEWNGYAYTELDTRLERFDGPNCIRLWPPESEQGRDRWAYSISDRNYDGEQAMGYGETYEEVDYKTQALASILNKGLDAA